MEREQFEALVKEAIAEMPRQFRDRLENVVVMIDDEPSEEMLIDMGMDPDETLLGLYEGVPLTERGVEAPLLPDRVWIFQGPIEDACESIEEIKVEVQRTIMHEIAHFFGIDDDALDEIGY